MENIPKRKKWPITNGELRGEKFLQPSVRGVNARLSPDGYALLRVLQSVDAAQIVWQAVRCIPSHNGDHNLWLEQGGLGLDLLLHQRHQLRHAAGHQSGQQRAQQTDRPRHRCQIPLFVRAERTVQRVPEREKPRE